MGITFAIMQRVRTPYFAEFFIHCLFWLGMYYALRGLTVSSYQLIDRSPGRDALRLQGHMLFPYAGVVLGFLMLLFYTCSLWLFKKVIRYKSNYARLAVVTGWLLLVYFANYLLVSMLAGARHNQYQGVPNIPDIAPFSFNWQQMQTVIALAFMATLGVAGAYFFMKEWIRNELARNEADAVQLNTELRFLRSQINPHFLFNTLNNLFAMALKDGKSSLANRIATLSNMMRYMLYESTTDKVSLAKEIGCLQDYLLLYEMRYAVSEVDISFHYPEPAAIAAVQVAPMLLIPFLENAFKHGVAIGQRSYIAMAISVNARKLAFTCENIDYSAIKKLEEEKGGIGLENVKRRLELIYPGRYTLQAGQQNEKYKVDLQINLL